MERKEKTAVIIAAAGQGRRMGENVPKQYLDLGGEPVLARTLRAFCRCPEVTDILVVTNREYMEHCRQLKDRYGLDKITAVVEGGAERQDSVRRALDVLEGCCPETEYVLVHDGARPFVNRETIRAVIGAARETGAAVAGVPVKDSIRRITGTDSRNVERKGLYAVQTPQGFRRQILVQAYEKAFADGYYGTDDASLVERLGQPVRIVAGRYDNVKITTKEDMPMESRVGTGFDVHQLTEGRPLVLGGVTIPFERGLLGHSDADVLLHALMDALLGAAGLGDIGGHFPDTDPQYKDISSLRLLALVKECLTREGYSISNVDITLMAQRPKIKPYISRMRENIAETLAVDGSRVSIKGTTTERLGFVGREEGMAAQAVCLLCR